MGSVAPLGGAFHQGRACGLCCTPGGSISPREGMWIMLHPWGEHFIKGGQVGSVEPLGGAFHQGRAGGFC